MGICIEKHGQQSIIREGRRYYVHDRNKGVWAFGLPLKEARRLAKMFATGCMRREDSDAND